MTSGKREITAVYKVSNLEIMNHIAVNLKVPKSNVRPFETRIDILHDNIKDQTHFLTQVV